MACASISRNESTERCPLENSASGPTISLQDTRSVGILPNLKSRNSTYEICGTIPRSKPIFWEEPHNKSTYMTHLRRQRVASKKAQGVTFMT